jgi:hypothetical protein
MVCPKGDLTPHKTHSLNGASRCTGRGRAKTNFGWNSVVMIF